MRQRAGLKYGKPAMNRPRPAMTAVRRSTAGHAARSGPASAIAVPMMTRNHGKMRSVGVQPCHSACSSGA